MGRGYIPAPARGLLHVGPDAPTAKPNLVWLDIKSGAMFRFDERMDQWLPYSVASPAWGGAYAAVSLGDVTADQAYAVAVGNAAAASDYAAVAIGSDVNALGTGSIAIGQSARAATWQAGVAIGRYARAGDDDNSSSNCVAIGERARTDFADSVAVGNYPHAAGSSSVAIGSYAEAGIQSVALGVSANAGAESGAATAEMTVAIGPNTAATADHATAVGDGASAYATASIALGSSSFVATEADQGAIAIGLSSTVGHPRSIALGQSSQTTAADQAVISAHELVLHPTTGIGSTETPGVATSLVLFSPNGSRWRLTVDDTGALTTSPVV